MPRARVSDQGVLDAARRALDDHGWSKLTAEQIAVEAGVSRVTLHRRGWTKETILQALATEAEARYRERMWPVLTTEGSGRSRIELALLTICELAEESMNLLLALDEAANASVFHDDGDEDALTRSAFTEPLERLLRDGVMDGTLQDTPDPVETATVLFNMVGWTYIHLRSGHRWSAERARRTTLRLALGGIGVS